MKADTKKTLKKKAQHFLPSNVPETGTSSMM